MKPTNEKVQFRLLQMPCCNILICWVNPRRPMYCPECGKRVFHNYPKARWDTQYSDAWLRIENCHKASWLTADSYQQAEANTYTFDETETPSRPSEKSA